jgi:hypothetical protein
MNRASDPLKCINLLFCKDIFLSSDTFDGGSQRQVSAQSTRFAEGVLQDVSVAGMHVRPPWQLLVYAPANGVRTGLVRHEIESLTLGVRVQVVRDLSRHPTVRVRAARTDGTLRLPPEGRQAR